jgi:hypothetical protein
VAELALDDKISKQATIGVGFSTVSSARQQDLAVKAHLSIAF